MSYIDKHLIANERLVYRTRLHWIIFAKPVTWIVAWFFITGYYRPAIPSHLVFIDNLAYLILLWGCVLLATQIVNYLCAEFGVTNKRILTKTGFIQIHSLELMLSRVESIQVDQTLLGRLLGYGSLIICGTGGSKELFPLIDHPLHFRRIVQEQLSS